MENCEFIGLAVFDVWLNLESVAEHPPVIDTCLNDPIDFVGKIFDDVLVDSLELTSATETDLASKETDIVATQSDNDNLLIFLSPPDSVTFFPADETLNAKSDCHQPIGAENLENSFFEQHEMAEASSFSSSETLICLAESDETDGRRHSYSFHSHSGAVAQSDSEPCEPASSAKVSIGLISDILDGVVFAPVGTSEPPQLSPHTRSRSTLLSFRPAAEPEESDHSVRINPESIPDTSAARPFKSNAPDLVRIINPAKSALTHLPPDLETLFQQELAAKIKKRCLLKQQQEAVQPAKGAKNEPPPETRVTETPEFENPLYQSLQDCLSGTIPPAPPLPSDWHQYDRVDDDATYADIDETETYHYKTVKPSATRKVKEEAIYAQVGDRTCKANKSESAKAAVADKEPEAIYENVEELQEVEQTYANILPVADNSNTGKVLTALVLDVDTAVVESRALDLSSRSSGHSSSSPSDSSPEQLSPADSLANVSVGSVRSIGTPDSGVFGLLRPASEDAVKPEDAHEKQERPSKEKIELLNKTLKQFEQLEELSCEIATTKPPVKVEKSVSFAREMSVDIQMETLDAFEKFDVNEDAFVNKAQAVDLTTTKSGPNVNDDETDKKSGDGTDGHFEAKLASRDSDQKNNGDYYAEQKRPESRVVSPEPENLGVRIFEDITKKKQRLERERNQKLGLVEVGDSFEKLNSKRFDLIEEMTPKKPKKIEWLPTSIVEKGPSGKIQPEKENHPSQTGLANTNQPSDSKEERNTSADVTMQLGEAPFVALPSERKAEHTQMRAISPPPGFDSEGMHYPAEEAQSSEPFLGNDDFVDVASITFKDDEEDSKPGVQFEKEEDDDEEEEDFVGTQTLQFDRIPATKGSHPLPALYFEPDHSSRDESDDDLEASSSVSSFSMKEPVHNAHNPTETLIEREIRLQREREEAVLRERQQALEMLEAKKHSKTTETVSHQDDAEKLQPITVDTESVTSTTTSTTRKAVEPKRASESAISPAEIRISEEIREFKRREEELRLLREAHMRVQQPNNVDHSSLIASAATEDEGLFSDAERDVCSEANSSRVESPEAGILSSSEYSKFPHQRTQSMDSMSSGHSSGDHGPTVYGQIHSSDQLKRGRPSKSVVMPLENPSDEEVPVYRRMSKETPIEREIRLAREREEALRREKGFQPASCNAAPTRKTSNENRTAYRSGNSIPENRNAQHRYATSVIQREIEEIAERENELLRDGKIQTTSVERVDSKVTAVTEFPKIADSKRMLAKSSSVPPKSYELEERPVNKSATLQAKGISAAPSRQFSTLNSTQPNQIGRRNFGHAQGGQRGIMEKFILSRGRLNQPATFNLPSTMSPVSLIPPQNISITPGSTIGDPAGVTHAIAKTPQASVRHGPTVVRPIEIQSFKHEEEGSHGQEATPVRRYYATTEEKIQQEFREMQQREEELRLTRSKLLAKSQPNLLDIDDAPSGVDTSSRGMRAAHSISDLLADEQANGDARQQDGKAYGTSTTTKGARRKSALIAQWESRIHQQDF